VLVSACASLSDGGLESTAPGDGAVGTTPTSQPPSEAAERPVATDAAVPNSTEERATIEPTTEPSRTDSTTEPPTAFADCLEDLTIRAKIALLVWPAVYSNAWSQAIDAVSTHHVGGVVLMRPQGWSAGELRERLGELEAATPFGVIVATDEEGGDVQRLAFVDELASQEVVSETGTTDDASLLMMEHAAKVRAVGIDMAFGPVVDVAPPSGQVPLQRSRFFTGDPSTVAAYARVYIDAWLANGITPVIKHFPGHGAASADTHLAAGNTAPLSSLVGWDLVPYRALADSGAAVMVGHLTVPGLTDGAPATRSRAAIDYLRGDLGFGDTLVITDALGMNAVGLGTPEAAVAALIAGLDVAIFTDTSATGAVIDAIERAVDEGGLPVAEIDDSARRVLRILSPGRDGCGSTSS